MEMLDDSCVDERATISVSAILADLLEMSLRMLQILVRERLPAPIIDLDSVVR